MCTCSHTFLPSPACEFTLSGVSSESSFSSLPCLAASRSSSLLYSPFRTVLVTGSARSRGDLPSVLRMVGSAPCWSSTGGGGEGAPCLQQVWGGRCVSMYVRMCLCLRVLYVVRFTYKCTRPPSPCVLTRGEGCSSNCPWCWGLLRVGARQKPPRSGQRSTRCAEGSGHRHPVHLASRH